MCVQCNQHIYPTRIDQTWWRAWWGEDATKCNGACGLAPGEPLRAGPRSGAAATWLAIIERVLVRGHGPRYRFVFGSRRRQVVTCSYMPSLVCVPSLIKTPGTLSSYIRLIPALHAPVPQPQSISQTHVDVRHRVSPTGVAWPSSLDASKTQPARYARETRGRHEEGESQKTRGKRGAIVARHVRLHEQDTVSWRRET